jgi:hypothetical protein
MPHAGAASFRAEVVEVQVSGNAGRETSAFLLSVAAMDAIADYLLAWEDEQRVIAGGEANEGPQRPHPRDASDEGDTIEPTSFGSAVGWPDSSFVHLSEYDLRCVRYQSCYIAIRVDVESGVTEDAIRGRYNEIIKGLGPDADVVVEALDDALAGRPMRYKDPVEP